MPSRKRHLVPKHNSDRPRTAFSWFPPHMHRAQEHLLREARDADLIIEVRDARLPRGSGNPHLQRILGSKPRLLVFNKASLADAKHSRGWSRQLREAEDVPLFTDVTDRGAPERLLSQAETLLRDRRNRFRRRGIRPPASRVIVTGIPNVGKSTLINRILHKRRLAAGPEPGVTRKSAWVLLRGTLCLLDTPGVLLPRIQTNAQAHRLAWIGAVPPHLMDTVDVAAELLNALDGIIPSTLRRHYRIATEPFETGSQVLTRLAKHRNFLTREGAPDLMRIARQLLNDFQAGKLGRVTFETPDRSE